jgi:hypothetical protein
MLFRQTENKDGDDVLRKLPALEARLHSIAAVLRGRHFNGSFQAGGSSYEVVYAPTLASVVGRRLHLQGRLTVKDARNQTLSRNQVRATLVGIQGGIGAALPRRQNQTSAATTSSGLPEVESTGPTSFCGAMYIHFEPLAGRAFGVAADLSRVQLNARFAPVNDAERALQSLYSSIVDALYGKQVDGSGATTAVIELNKLLAGN